MKWINLFYPRSLPQSPRMGFPLIEVRMSTHFRGRFEIKVDPKFRLTLPAVFREVLKDTADSRMIVTNSQYQGKRCLDVYPFHEWKKLENRIAQLPQLKVEVQNFQRFYLSGGHPVESDANSRIPHSTDFGGPSRISKQTLLSSALHESLKFGPSRHGIAFLISLPKISIIPLGPLLN